MNLNWSGQERISADKATVWNFINDPAKIAACLPDVQSTSIIDAHSFNATVGVAVGPVRGKFTFKIVLEPRADGNHMDLKISGGGLGSVVDLVAGADLSTDGANDHSGLEGDRFAARTGRDDRRARRRHPIAARDRHDLREREERG